MLFGQSIFQSVLDRLDAEEAETAPETPNAARRIVGLNASFAADVREGVSAASAQPGQAYFDNLDPEAFRPRPEVATTEAPPEPKAEIKPAPAVKPVERIAVPVMPSHLSRTSPQAVADELGISSRDTLQTLNDKRRSFAKANHPDGIDAMFRDRATTRMKIANLLIDEAIRRIERRSKLSR